MKKGMKFKYEDLKKKIKMIKNPKNKNTSKKHEQSS